VTQLTPMFLSLTRDEKALVQRQLGRKVTPLEWSIIDAEWSEHCSYKSSKSLLKELPTKGARVLLGPGFDAGVLDVGDGYVVTIHVESHNHPSAIDPYGGAATGVGGVLRDILSIGSRPIALLDPLRFGDVTKSGHSRWLMKNVIRGIAEYGNCVGIPTVGGEIEFDSSFESNCLVDVACVGLGQADTLVYSQNGRPGDQLMLVGGSTGRDGIRGATFASRNLTGNEKDRAAVQVPDPFTEKLIIEATLEAKEAGALRAMKDLGGGGLACAVPEAVSSGNCGADIDLSLVHVRESDLIAEEVMASESQERMLYVVDPKRTRHVEQILQRYGLPYSTIGHVIKQKVIKVRKSEKLLANLPVDLVVQAPLLQRRSLKPKSRRVQLDPPRSPTNMGEIVLQLLASPSIASKSWVYGQYDHEVGVRTILKPGAADASVLRLPNGKFLALTCDGNSKHCSISPGLGAEGSLAEACRNLACVGALPIGMVDHLQFGDPGDHEVFWSFQQTVRGLSRYCRAIDLPCVGGKVSFYNEDSDTKIAIKPSPVVVVVGLIDNKAPKLFGFGLKEVGDALIIVGSTAPELGGSEYYEQIHGFSGGKVPKVDLRNERKRIENIVKIYREPGIKSVHDCSKGGLIVTLAEMCIEGGLGASVEAEQIPAKTRQIDELLFSESHGRFILEVNRKMVKKIMKSLEDQGLPVACIGQVDDGSHLRLKYGGKTLVDLSVPEMKQRWAEAIPRLMGDIV